MKKHEWIDLETDLVSIDASPGFKVKFSNENFTVLFSF